MKGRKLRTTWLLWIGSRKQEEGRGGRSERKEVEDYLATGERRKEAGSRKREEEEGVKVRMCRTTWLQGRGGRKQEAGRWKMRRK